jgi:hypothetical protein
MSCKKNRGWCETRQAIKGHELELNQHGHSKQWVVAPNQKPLSRSPVATKLPAFEKRVLEMIGPPCLLERIVRLGVCACSF